MSELSKNYVPLYLIPIVAMGFATTQISWGLFNLTVPIILRDEYSISIALIGFIMTWDNILAFFIQPTIGTLSDQVRTRFGRRMPFIIPGVIIGSIFFFFLSISRLFALQIFLINIVIFNVIMALYRSPSASLMPDMVQSKDRSLANGIGNSAAGIIAGVILLLATFLIDDGGFIPAYGFVAIIMIVLLIILVLVIHEPEMYRNNSEDGDLKIKPKINSTKAPNGENTIKKENLSISDIFVNLKIELRNSYNSSNKSLLYILLAILAWFMAVSSIEAFYSTFVWQRFIPNVSSEVAAKESGRVIFIFPIIFVIFAIIGGILGNKIGRIKTSKIGTIVMVFGIIFTVFITPSNLENFPISWQNAFRIAFTLAGAGWGLVTVNSIVIVWEHTQDNGIGTGLYYAFASAGTVLGPTFAGILMSILGIEILFVYTVIFFVLGSVLIFQVITGEAGDHAILRRSDNVAT